MIKSNNFCLQLGLYKAVFYFLYSLHNFCALFSMRYYAKIVPESHRFIFIALHLQ